MSNDLMLIIQSLEKDKGIDKDILIKTITSSIEAVTRKTLALGKEIPLDVKIDTKTGQILIYKDNAQIKVEQLGRIAAQTTKQVIIQKVKEAETSVVYEQYKDKKGSLVNGIIQRFEKNSVILAIGRAMAVLPRSEQVFRDDYQLSDRLKTCITDIQHTRSDIKLIVSRSTVQLVQKLFEFEVPEIAEGVLEIKGIVREAGDRTKIAIHSNVSKIDSVGACVGMRGCRVKSIVSELRGEKVDIVRWDEDPEKFIRNVLNSAEILRMDLDIANRACEVLVPEDKLSLAIGKKGQNIRLSVKLTGWNINIQSQKKTSAYSFSKLFKDEMNEEEIENLKKEALTALSSVENIDENLAQVFIKSGFTTLDQIKEESVENIAQVINSTLEEAQNIVDAINEKRGIDKI